MSHASGNIECFSLKRSFRRSWNKVHVHHVLHQMGSPAKGLRARIATSCNFRAHISALSTAWSTRPWRPTAVTAVFEHMRWLLLRELIAGGSDTLEQVMTHSADGFQLYARLAYLSLSSEDLQWWRLLCSGESLMGSCDGDSFKVQNQRPIHDTFALVHGTPWSAWTSSHSVCVEGGRCQNNESRQTAGFGWYTNIVRVTTTIWPHQNFETESSSCHCQDYALNAVLMTGALIRRYTNVEQQTSWSQLLQKRTDKNAADVRVMIDLGVLLLLSLTSHRETFKVHRATLHAEPSARREDSVTTVTEQKDRHTGQKSGGAMTWREEHCNHEASCVSKRILKKHSQAVSQRLLQSNAIWLLYGDDGVADASRQKNFRIFSWVACLSVTTTTVPVYVSSYLDCYKGTWSSASDTCKGAAFNFRSETLFACFRPSRALALRACSATMWSSSVPLCDIGREHSDDDAFCEMGYELMIGSHFPFKCCRMNTCASLAYLSALCWQQTGRTLLNTCPRCPHRGWRHRWWSVWLFSVVVNAFRLIYEHCWSVGCVRRSRFSRLDRDHMWSVKLSTMTCRLDLSQRTLLNLMTLTSDVPRQHWCRYHISASTTLPASCSLILDDEEGQIVLEVNAMKWRIGFR